MKANKNKNAVKNAESKLEPVLKAKDTGKVRGIVMMPIKLKPAVKAKPDAKAKAKVAAAKAKEKAAKQAKRAADAIAKAKEKASELEKKATIARNKQVNTLTPAEMRAKTKKELDDVMSSFIRQDLGLKADGVTMDAMQACFHKGATSIKLVPLSKCAHNIGMKLGLIPESDDTVSNLSCRACYPKSWDSIRDTYNKVATAFKKAMGNMADAHKASYNLKASAKTTKTGKTVKSGVIGMSAKVIGTKVTDTAVKLTSVLQKNAVQVAMARVNAIGSAVILSKADFLRYVRHFTSRTGKDAVFSISTPPAWMTDDMRKEVERRINDGVEKAEVTLLYLQSQARIAAKAKGIKVAA